jgi:hypothetical protein
MEWYKSYHEIILVPGPNLKAPEAGQNTERYLNVTLIVTL